MNFDHTYITFFGAVLFEPVVVLTNTLTTLFCIFAFVAIKKYRSYLSTQWAWFFLLIGISSSFGSLAHGIQYQLGDLFLKSSVFMVNAISLIAIYFCFQAANTYFNLAKPTTSVYVTYLVIAWIIILLVITFLQNSFLLIKIHAGIVLFYSFIVHLIAWSRKQKGSGLVAFGIFVSFLSILTHSIRLSLHEYFNYKDISHVIMIISLVLIYSGVKAELDRITSGSYSTVA